MPFARGFNQQNHQSQRITVQRGHYDFGAPKVENVPQPYIQPPIHPISWSPFEGYLFADKQIKRTTWGTCYFQCWEYNKVLSLLFGGGNGEAKRQQFFLDCQRDWMLWICLQSPKKIYLTNKPLNFIWGLSTMSTSRGTIDNNALKVI